MGFVMLTAASLSGLLIQSPGITAFFQLRDGVISDRISFLCQTFFQSTDDLSRAPQREGDCVPKDFSLHHSLERKKKACKKLHLVYDTTRSDKRALEYYDNDS
jgi:hypothetical protein